MLENDRPKNPKQFPYVRIESETFELGFVLLLSKPKNKTYKGDVLLEFSSVKWVLNEDHSLYSNLLGTLLL